MDASISGPMDAGVLVDAALRSDSAIDAGVLPCGGARVFGLCWYLAGTDTSCSDACTSRGGFDPRAIEYIGTPSQGGSAAECQQVMIALGRSGTVGAAERPDKGLGCHLWNDGALYWLQSPSFEPTAVTPAGTDVRLACACLQ
jgi:hypothetical protein